MAAGYSYSDWVSAVAAAIEYPITDPTSPTPSSDPSFNIWMPRAIEYAEQRIYRELDMLLTRDTDSSGTLTPNSRTFTLPVTASGIFIVLEQVSPIVANVQQAPMLPVSKDALEAFWPSDTALSSPSIPTMWCQVDQKTIMVAPPPDSAYGVKCFGTIRPAPLSSTNIETVLTQYVPDLFFAASMISWSGYLRDYGQQADDPTLAQSWENQYDKLFKGAAAEELRKKFQAQGWSCRLPSPLATPPQT